MKILFPIFLFVVNFVLIGCVNYNYRADQGNINKMSQRLLWLGYTNIKEVYSTNQNYYKLSARYYDKIYIFTVDIKSGEVLSLTAN